MDKQVFQTCFLTFEIFTVIQLMSIVLLSYSVEIDHLKNVADFNTFPVKRVTFQEIRLDFHYLIQGVRDTLGG